MGWLGAILGGVVGFLVGGPVGAVIGAGLGATKVGEKVINSVMDFVLSPFMPKLPDGGQDAAAREQGVLIQRSGSTVAIPVVYGLRKVGGAIAFAETGSTNNQYLWVAYVFAEGQIEGLHELWLDDIQLVDSAGGPGYIQRLNAGELVSIDSGRFSGRAQFRFYPGVYYNDPTKSTIATTVKADVFANAPSFTNQMVYNGLAVLFARYEWKEIKTQADADANPFSGKIPEAQALILGKRVASLLTDSTESLTYDQTVGDPSLNRYSTNPAECLLDYLRNPRYGKGLVNTDIDWATWRTAARKFNQTVTYLDANGTPTGPILTVNAVVDTGQSLMNNVKFLLSNSRAYMPYVQGKYKLKIEDAGNPTDILSGSAEIAMTFTKDDIVSDITYLGIDKSSKYNVVAVTYVDPNSKWSNQVVVYPETESERQRYIDLDGGRENKYDVTYGCITNYPMAKDMARLIFNKQRRQESCVFTGTSKALELEPGDNIRIQSNILNFGIDPWRVISIKINNDMTVNLGCVRNPDDMYPYVRVGEEDYVLTPYIPKGSSRIVPSSQNDLALNPPIKAQFPPNTSGIQTNPSPTDPNSIGGGGVGGGNPGGGTAGPTTGTPTTPNTQPTPAPVPKLADFAAALALKKVSSADQGNGTSIFTLTFTQPSDSLYDKSTLWWRINQNSPWATIELTNKPGAGGEISTNIPGLPNTYFTPYSFYVRSYATDGRGSIQVLQGTFGNVQNQTTGLIVGTGSASQIQVASGWVIPASTVVTATPVYNDSIDYSAIVPKLPSDPRRLTLKIQQLQNTISGTVNNLINGVTVYYKFKTDTYWEHETFTYPGNYTFGQLSFDLAGDFGARGTTGSLQQYDFLVRLNYSDGRAAEKQMGPATAPVEVSGTGLTVYDIFGTSSSASASVKSATIPTGFALPLVEQNTTNSFAVGSDIVPVVQVSANVYNNSLLWSFTPPNNSKFRGYKIRYRQVVAGANTTYSTVTVGAAANVAGVIPMTIADSTYAHGIKYEWVITAQYSVSGVTTDCLNSLYGQALIPAGDANWNGVDLFAKIFTGTQPILTTLALGNLAISFPGLPTVNPKSWIKKQPQAYNVNTMSTFGSPDVYAVGGGVYYINSWYELKFQPDGASDNIVIYRRVYDSYGLQRTTTGSNAKYWQLGAWEKKTVSLASLSTDAAGWKILNVRGPIDTTLFDPYYQVSGYGSRVLYANNYGPSPSIYPFGPGSSPSTNNIYPYYGVGNSAVGTGVTRYAEFIFVLATGATEQTKGLRLTEFQTTTSGVGYKTEVDGFVSGNIKKDDVVTVSDFNTLDSGYARRLSEAITVSSFNQLAKGSAFYGGVGVPQYPTTGGGYSYYLRQPESGTVTVY